jgi:hypothetical protein
MELARRSALIAAFGIIGCHTITEDLPPAASQPTGPTLVLPVVITPVSNPTLSNPTNPTPTPSATPTPATGATPTPTPTPSVPSATCSPGNGSGSGNQCTRTTPELLGAVQAAIDDVIRQEPGIFDLNDRAASGSYRVLDETRYHDAVVASLRSRGLCAEVMGYEEIAVKRDNSFGEGYDILLSSGHIRRGEGSYRGTCRPAWF